MNNNYMVYPLKYMRITCRYDEASHAKHNINVSDGIVDYPIDDGGRDTGRDPIYCPCDEMRVTAVRGVGQSNVTNTIWLVSTTPVVTPTFTDYAYMSLTHSNDEDLRNIQVGKTFKRGEIICYEGTDGATNNHIHITCGRGSSSTWRENSNGSWVISGDSKRPEEVFYLDRSFTEEIWGSYIPWIVLSQTYVGTPVERNNSRYQVEVLVDNLNARISPNLNSSVLGYINRGIYNILGTVNNDGYTWIKIEDFYIATNDNWVKIYEIEETNCQEELEKLKSSLPKEIFVCTKSGRYIIYLQKGNKLYIS